MEKGKPPQLSTAARTEISYSDFHGNPVNPDKAVRVITRAYDEEGTLINTTMTYSPIKSTLPS